MAQTADGTLCCIYENQIFTRQNDTRYVTVARFDLAWLTIRDRSRNLQQKGHHGLSTPRNDRARRR